MKAVFVLIAMTISGLLAQAPVECQLDFYDYGQTPACDDTGCSSDGPVAYTATLDTSNGSVEVNMGISEISWSGDCFCLLRLWTGPEGTGDTAIHRLIDSGDVMISDILDQPDQSFRVACLF